MIKIEVPEIDVFRKHYIVSIKALVKSRIEPLIKSVEHINSGVIDITEGNFRRYKHVTRKIINEFIDGKNLKESSFNGNKYKTTVRAFVRKGKKKGNFGNINFTGIKKFLEFLLESNDIELEQLLVCAADKLKSTNDRLLKQYGVVGDEDKIVLKLAFNYEEFDEISDAIKTHFRSRNLVKFCPYCNLTEVKFIPTPTGRPATTHELDHFFDKASFPLLSYSVFNLIPSDRTCNGINKSGKEFTDKYHSNPYVDGFIKKMKFKPDCIGRKVTGIQIEILAGPTEKVFSQMLGSIGKIDESNEEGNINVFALYSKYNSRSEEAEDILETIYRADNGRRMIKKFIDKMRGLDINEHYKDWYKKNIKTFFDEDKFHEKGYSKFNRDMHDFYFESDKKRRNNYIRNMIE